MILALPLTSKVALGVLVPMPSLLFVLSKKRLLLFSVTTPDAPMKGIEPGVKPERVRSWPEAMVAPPLKVARPVTPNVLPSEVAPLVTVKPLEPVSNPAEVTVPVPVVAMFPVVDKSPFSLMVSVVEPPDWIAREVLVAAFVSLMTKAFAVPALVKVNDVAVPESVDASYKVNARSRPVVVVMVLPAL